MLPANAEKPREHLPSPPAPQILLAVSGTRAKVRSSTALGCFRSTAGSIGPCRMHQERPPVPTHHRKRDLLLEGHRLACPLLGLPSAVSTAAWPGMKEGPRSQEPAAQPACGSSSAAHRAQALHGLVVLYTGAKRSRNSQCAALQPTWQLVDLGCIHLTAYVTAHK